MAEQRLRLPVRLREFRKKRITYVLALHMGEVHRVDDTSLHSKAVNLSTPDDEDLILAGITSHIQCSLQGSQAQSALCDEGRIPGQHYVGSAGQRPKPLWDALPILTAHYYMVADCGGFEESHVITQGPYQVIISTYDQVLRNSNNQTYFHRMEVNKEGAIHLKHIFPNQPKFFAGAVQFYNIPQINHTWFVPDQILTSQRAQHPTLNVDSIQNLPYDSEQNHYICHSVLGDNEKIASTLVAQGKKVFIQLWGGDTDHLFHPNKLFDEFGLQHESRLSKFHFLPDQILNRLTVFKWYASQSRRHKTRSLLRRCIAVSTQLGQAELASLKLHKTKAHPLVVNFQGHSTTPATTYNFNNYLIGNCALPSCRHVEVIKAAEKESANHITIPLSYPDNSYGSKLETWIINNIKCPHKVIRNFMPKAKYFELTSTAGTHIHYGIKQQALGNIFSAIYQRRKVVLNPESPTYRYLNEKGIRTYSLAELHLTPSLQTLDENARRLREIFELERTFTAETKLHLLLNLFGNPVKSSPATNKNTFVTR